MCEVTKENFSSLLPEIRELVDEAKFIAIDAEFTGISLQTSNNFSLRDGGSSRYGKLKAIAKEFSLCQIGLSIFVKEKDENQFIAHTYTFYLFPDHTGSEDVRFGIQVSSLSFLRQHGFNFNKWIQNGIGYLNNQQEKALREASLESSDDAIVQKFREIVGWLRNAKCGDQLQLEAKHFSFTVRMQSIMDKLLPPNKVVLKDISGLLYAKCLDPIDDSTVLPDDISVASWDQIVDEMVGFTHVVRHLCQSGKPIVGHNVLLDLLFICDKFICDLPDSYEEFKATVHAALPIVYDTKQLCYEMKQFVARGDRELLAFSSLADLFFSLSSARALQSRLMAPAVVHCTKSSIYDGHRHWHEAGFDAYMTGCVFVRVLSFALTSGFRVDEVQKAKFSRLLQLASPYKNRLRIPRSAILYCNLEGLDKSRCLYYLHVSPRQGVSDSAFSQLAQLLSGFGAVESHQLDRQRALVVAGSKKCGDMLLQDFEGSDVFIMRPYWFFDSPFVRSAARWICVVGVILLASGYKYVKLR
ncbi:poly(A)-specific ribonuclease PARN-like [Corticium candelabrum]|uniref:poly(A)-specific ribonuclease PARN-like n=1 Tax=Corticium candelabrum TaxID=121492 RepID=UPI002E2754B6|nr:poly(A)-specific ribonuclease PARN-like [Corticium candelabrum]